MTGCLHGTRAYYTEQVRIHKTVTDFKESKCISKWSVMDGETKAAGPVRLMCKGGWSHSVGYRRFPKAVVGQFLAISDGACPCALRSTLAACAPLRFPGNSIYLLYRNESTFSHKTTTFWRLHVIISHNLHGFS
jgi:hypothetical protein